MKYLFLSCLAFGSLTILSAQTLPKDLPSTWKLQEGNDGIIEITYTLDRVDDSRYYKVIVRGFVDDRPITMSSIGGDVGPSVRYGKDKQILWQWERDVTEISGELKFIVTQDYSADAVTTTPPGGDSDERKAGLPMINHPGIYLGVPAGVGLAVTGLLNSSSAKSDWDAETIRTADTYDPLNKKYKNGQILTFVGAAAVIGGITWYLVENAQFKKLSSDSGLQILPDYVRGHSLNGDNSDYLISGHPGLTLTYTF